MTTAIMMIKYISHPLWSKVKKCLATQELTNWRQSCRPTHSVGVHVRGQRFRGGCLSRVHTRTVEKQFDERFIVEFSTEELDGPESDDASGFSVRFTDANTNVHDNSGTVYSLLEVLLTGLIMRLS